MNERSNRLNYYFLSAVGKVSFFFSGGGVRRTAAGRTTRHDKLLSTNGRAGEQGGTEQGRWLWWESR